MGEKDEIYYFWWHTRFLTTGLGQLVFGRDLFKEEITDIQRLRKLWKFFWGIIIVSLVPIIIIYRSRSKHLIFDTIKPVVNILAIISTIFLFLLKTFGVVKHDLIDYSLNAILNNIGYVVVQYLTFLIYPYAIAFKLGQYFVKKEQLLQKQAN